MLHVVTVHHRDPRWIDIQVRYLHRHLPERFRLWGSLEGIPPRWHEPFDEVVPSRGRHAGKLNLLAAEVGAVAQPDDLLMFLDGDAFPIADPVTPSRALLEEVALVAVQRRENLGDVQPHPCFAIIRVGTWLRLRGDWSVGHTWTNENGDEVSDVGGNLLRALERNQEAWHPVLRSNGTGDNPLRFAVYGDMIYHHGVGFRRDTTRVAAAAVPFHEPWRRADRVRAQLHRLARHRLVRREERIAREVYAHIERDADFLALVNR